MESSSQSSARSRRRLYGGLALAGAALAVPALAHALIQRRLRAPRAPGWGRTHRFAGHFGPVVFQELGAGPAVVLLHAFGPGFDGGQWQAVAESLAPRFRALAPDLPGWGRSAQLEPRPQAYLACLADFLAGVAWGGAGLVAAGHAAPYAIHLAAECPTLVRGLALVAPLGLPTGGAGHHENAGHAPAPAAGEASAAAGAPVPPGGEARADLEPEPPVLAAPAAARSPAAPAPANGAAHSLVAQLMAVPLLRTSVLDALTSRAVLGSYLRNHAYAAGERVDAALLEHHYRVSHLPAHRLALAAYWRGDLDLPAAAALRGLQIPVWIGASGEDAANRPGAGALPPGAQVEVFEGTRALPHAEKPMAVGKALARFLDQLPPA